MVFITLWNYQIIFLVCVHCLSSLQWKLLERFCYVFTPESPVPRTGLGTIVAICLPLTVILVKLK